MLRTEFNSNFMQTTLPLTRILIPHPLATLQK